MKTSLFINYSQRAPMPAVTAPQARKKMKAKGLLQGKNIQAPQDPEDADQATNTQAIVAAQIFAEVAKGSVEALSSQTELMRKNILPVKDGYETGSLSRDVARNLPLVDWPQETCFVYDTGLLYAYIPITTGSYGIYEERAHHDYEMHIFHQRDQKWQKITNPRVIHDLLASYDSENISAITAQIILEKQLKES